MKFETRDLVALVSLAIVLAAMAAEVAGHALPEWLKEPIGGILGFILGYYFAASPRQAQGSPVQTPPASPSVPVTDEVSRRPIADAQGSVSPPELSSSLERTNG